MSTMIDTIPPCAAPAACSGTLEPTERESEQMSGNWVQELMGCKPDLYAIATANGTCVTHKERWTSVGCAFAARTAINLVQSILDDQTVEQGDTACATLRTELAASLRREITLQSRLAAKP